MGRGIGAVGRGIGAVGRGIGAVGRGIGGKLYIAAQTQLGHHILDRKN